MYKLVALAGTFDRLHKGHEQFISQAFNYGDKVIIGLTSDTFVRSKIFNLKFSIYNQFSIFNFQTRKIELEKLLKQMGLFHRSTIVVIDDLYGPAISNREIDALAVTKETKEGGEKVNAKRKEMGLPPLKLIIIPFILAQDRQKIASTRIREGEIDRMGTVYGCQLLVVSGKLPESIRQELKKPQGDLIQGDPDHLENIGSELTDKLINLQSPFIITVGDEVTKVANAFDLKPKLSIFDFRVNRKEKYHSLSELGINLSLRAKRSNLYRSPRFDVISDLAMTTILSVTNPPGFITKELIGEIKRSLEKIISGKEEKIVIKIEGEDDLAAVPAILLAPLGSVVIYGQPGEGVVIVEVTEEKKEEMIDLLALSGKKI